MDISKIEDFRKKEEEKAIDSLTKVYMEEKPYLPTNKLESEEQYNKKVKIEVESAAKETEEIIGKAFEILSESDSEEVRKVLEKTSQILSDLIKEKSSLSTEENQNVNFLEKLSISFSNSHYQAIYKISQDEFSKENFENAKSLFTLLTILFPKYCSNWIGLALSIWRLGDVEGAGSVFDFAVNAFEDPELLIYAIDFYKNNNNIEKIDDLSSELLDLLEKNPEEYSQFLYMKDQLKHGGH